MPCFVYCRRGSWRPIGHMRPSSPLLDSNWLNYDMFCVLQAGFLASYWSHASLLPPPGLLLVKWCHVCILQAGFLASYWSHASLLPPPGLGERSVRGSGSDGQGRGKHGFLQLRDNLRGGIKGIVERIKHKRGPRFFASPPFLVPSAPREEFMLHYSHTKKCAVASNKILLQIWMSRAYVVIP